MYESEPGLRCPEDADVSGEILARHAFALVGDTVGLLLLLFLRLLPCRLCRNNELTGNVARIGPCFVVEHGDDLRIRCDPDIVITLDYLQQQQ